MSQSTLALLLGLSGVLFVAACLEPIGASETRGPSPLPGGAASLTAQPESLLFRLSALAPGSASAEVTLQGAVGTSVSVAVSPNVPWLSAAPTADTTPSTLVVRADSSGMPEGSYEGILTLVEEGGGGSSVTLGVTLIVAPPAWSPTGGPPGGIVSGMAWENAQVVYAAAWNGGVWRSPDRGLHWASVGLDGEVVQTVATCKGAAGPQVFAALYGAGISKSVEEGAEWIDASDGMSDLDVTVLACGPSVGSLYAGTSGGSVFGTMDGGETWTVAGFFPGLSVYSVLVLPDGTLLVGTSAGLEMRSPGAAGWRSASGSVVGAAVMSLDCDPANPMHVVAASYGAGLHESQDGGSTWEGPLDGTAGVVAQAISFDPARPGRLYAATHTGVWLSVDGGTTWSMQGPAADLLVLSVGPGGVALGGTDGRGILESTDGGSSWISAGTFAASTVDVVQYPSSLTTWAGTYGSGLYRSTTGGTQWFPVSTPGLDILSLWVDPNLGSHLLLSVDGAGLHESDDDGKTWQGVLDLGATSIYSIASSPTAPSVVFAGSYDAGVWRSEDEGHSWTAASQGLPSIPVWVVAVAMDGSVLAGTYGAGLFRSEDGGRSWFSIGHFSNVGAALEIGSRIFVGTLGQGIWLSTDGGANFQEVGADGSEIDCFLVERDGTILAGGDLGVWASSPEGLRWAALGEGSGALPVWSLVEDPLLDRRLLAGTDGGGVEQYQ